MTDIHDFQADIDVVGQIAVLPNILEVVCKTTGMGFAAVARVTEERWVACSVRDEILFGLKPGGELKIETTICNEIRQSREAVVIDQVSDDAAYRGHPTPAMYGFQSYISVPIILSDGSFFGTLCAIDPKPAKLKNSVVTGMFKAFSELLAFHIDGIRRVAKSEAALLDERSASELREQFIAVLGHDLRNPLASITGGTRLLLKTPLNDKAASIVGMMQVSADRMAALIDNVLDFARGRLGGGITLKRDRSEPIQPVLQHVIDELQIASPDRMIETDFDLAVPVDCDRGRIGQLFSNLLANAITYGPADRPIHVSARSGQDGFALSVSNSGPAITPQMLERLFRPFTRGAAKPSQQGLGLGLYISSEIARGHGGTLDATSSDAGTCFTFRMPSTKLG